MLVDDIGDVTITNDGATILRLLEVEHPAAKVPRHSYPFPSLSPSAVAAHASLTYEMLQKISLLVIKATLKREHTENKRHAPHDIFSCMGMQILVELAELQDQEVGDGTTSVVIVAAELLKRANELVRNKIHPTSIIGGYRIAMREVSPPCRILPNLIEHVQHRRARIKPLQAGSWA